MEYRAWCRELCDVTFDVWHGHVHSPPERGVSNLASHWLVTLSNCTLAQCMTLGLPGHLWTLSAHSRLTITPLKPSPQSSVISIHPDAHLTTTTLVNWRSTDAHLTTTTLDNLRWDGSYPGPMDNLMMATLMRWWPPWTHGQPDDGYPEMRWWLPWTWQRCLKPGTWTPWSGLDSKTTKKTPVSLH